MKRENQIFTAPFMDAQLEKAAWKHLSAETTDPAIATKLMREYSDKLHWKSLCGNRDIKWNIELLRNFAHRIDWEELNRTLFDSWRSGVDVDKWRIEEVIALIEEFENRWNWDDLSSEINHPQVEEILQKYASKLNWSNVANNRSVKWTIPMVSKFEQYLANVEDIEDTHLWCELAERRAEEIVAEILNK